MASCFRFLSKQHLLRIVGSALDQTASDYIGNVVLPLRGAAMAQPVKLYMANV